MKVFLALAVLTASSLSFADSHRDIYDLMYLPKAGTSYGFTEATYLEVTSEVENEDVDANGYVVEQTLGHALTDSFTFQVSLNYANTEIEFEDQNTETSGVSDPTFSARFRLMDEAFRWDLIGGTTLGPGVQETDSDGDSNNYTGGVIARLGTQFGQKQNAFQWAVTALYSRHFKSTHKDDGVTTREDAYNEMQLRGDVLFKLAESSIVRAGLTATQSEEREDDANTTFTESLVTALEAEYQHVLSKDFLLRAGAGYSITKYDDNDFEDANMWTLKLAANYQF